MESNNNVGALKAEEELSEEHNEPNPLRFLLFTWVSPMFTRGWARYRQGTLLTIDDLLVLPREETSSVSYEQFLSVYAAWRRGENTTEHREPTSERGDSSDKTTAAESPKQKHVGQPRELLFMLAKVNRRDLLLGALFRILQDTGNVGAPFILRALILWLGRYAYLGEAGGENKWEGFVLAIALALNNWLLWVFTNTSLFYTNKAFARMRSAMMMAVYEKTLRLDRSQVTNVGRIQQMHGSDTYKFIDMSIFMNSLWAAPLIITAAMVALYFFVGWAGLLALAVLLVLTPSQARVTSGMMAIRRATVAIADERIQAVNEFCQGIRVIKFMGWEPATIATVLAIRAREVARFRALFFLRSVMLTVMFSTSFIISIVVFGVAYALGDPVRPENVFPAMAMINVLRQPLTQLPLGLARLVDCNVGLTRICQYLALPEKETYVTALAPDEVDAYAAVVENVTAMYEWVPESNKGGRGNGRRGGAKNGGTTGRGSRGSPTAQADHTAAPSPTIAALNANAAASPTNGQDGGGVAAGAPAAAPAAPSTVLRPFMGPVSVKIPRGKLTIVIGPTGGGKSTLLDMIIGEALIDGGKCDAEHRPRVATDLDHVAYMTQEAWIMNATLRENVLMGSPYYAPRYAQAVNACELIPDLKQLAASDGTEIGERGINLSGGQKQRVAFARAVYSGRSMVLMDDPLSAVDAHVCVALFRRCIQSAMADRTRVLVTHQVQFLPDADHIIVVDRCQIAFEGTYEALRQSSIDPNVYAVQRQQSDGGTTSPSAVSPASPRNVEGAPAGRSPREIATSAASVHHHDSDEPIPPPRAVNDTEHRLMTTEHQELGSIKGTTISWYMRQQGVGWVMATMLCFTVAQCINVAAQLILSWWSAHTTLVGVRITDEQYVMWYGIFIVLSIGALMGETVPFNKSMLNCARGCHRAMLMRVLRAPSSYFDTTPVGRIISRFSKDLDNMDQQIPWTLGTTYQLVFSILGAIGIMTYAVQYLLIMWAVMLALFVGLFVYYGGTNRAQKRLEAINRSPLAAIMNETLSGLSTLRAYRMLPYCQEKHEIACDVSSRSTYSWRLSQRWLSVRIQTIGACVVLCSGVVFCGVLISLDRRDAIANLPTMALSLTNAIAMAQLLGILTNLSAELESALSSVERVKEYCDELPQERDVQYEGADSGSNTPGHDVDDYGDGGGEGCVEHRALVPALPQGWPATGALEFRHASLRYRKGLPLVLKDLNFVVPHGAKVGVVGRTGSGKSTLLLALFRIVELTHATEAEADDLGIAEWWGSSGSAAPEAPDGSSRGLGSIHLDGRDIATVAIRDLRNAITIIPQDPLLFAGTIRSNVDPFSQHSDARIWSVIDQVGLRERIEGTHREGDARRNAEPTSTAPQHDGPSTGLACPVAARGSNFSVGQRQLLCLARALLKNCRLLLLDEATASVDQETDAKIQRTIREAFVHCTVLTIAHRLPTIVNSDAVLVMDHGVVVEYDTPYNLLVRDGGPADGSGSASRGRRGIFKAMVDALGEEQAAALLAVVKEGALGAHQ